jgi:hypothetical protein
MRTRADHAAHSESINLTFSKPVKEQQAREAPAAAAGVKIVDDRVKNYFPMPLESSDQDDVRRPHRQDISQPDGRGIDMFISGDQLRKGAALNVVQIAELISRVGTAAPERLKLQRGGAPLRPPGHCSRRPAAPAPVMPQECRGKGKRVLQGG